jgi:16S rRNA G966 N2-methylase RsmD
MKLENKLEKLYCKDGLTDIEIGEKCNVSPKHVSDLRKKMGIKTINHNQRRYIFNPQEDLTDRQKSIIFGSLLGDGCIKNASKERRCFSVSHSDKQKDYLYWTYEELKNICPSDPKKYVSPKGYITYSLLTENRKDLFNYREKIYTPKKKVNEWWISKLDVLSVAIWYMDDGYLSRVNNSRNEYGFATNSFDEDEHILLQNFLQDLGIETSIRCISRKSGMQRNLMVCDSSFDAFTDLLSPHIINSMKYKIPSQEREEFLKGNVKSKVTKEQLCELYYDHKMTQKEMATHLGVHRLTISKYMRLFDVKARDSRKAQLNGKNNNAKRLKSGRYSERGLTSKELKSVNLLFKELREGGFPYPEVKDDSVYLNVLTNLKTKELEFEDGAYKYSPSGMKFIADLCPQIFHTKSKGSYTPFEIFNDDDMLKDCIGRTIKFSKKDTLAAIRSGLKTYRGNRCATNFSPVWAKTALGIIGIDSPSVLDFSSGFGGRLIGSYAYGASSYTGIDPWKDNIDSCRQIYNYIKMHKRDAIFDAKMICGKAEETLWNLNRKYDVVLTSPPYFSKEIYSDDKSQCYNKFSTYNNWKKNWLTPVLEKSYDLLNENGCMAIFMSDYEKIPAGSDCCDIMEKIGGNVDIYRFSIPKAEYNRGKTSKKCDFCHIIRKK